MSQVRSGSLVPYQNKFETSILTIISLDRPRINGQENPTARKYSQHMKIRVRYIDSI